MQKYFIRIFVVTGIILLYSFRGTNSGNPAITDRLPAVAGSLYPADKEELLNAVAGYFNSSSADTADQPLALIVPHAVYEYSGSVAAAAYRQIDRNADYNHIFIIGSSHTSQFEGASAYSGGDFITPLGKVRVDTLSGWLAKKYSFISDDPAAHASEHSIEVQLPFLQYWLKKPFSIVPILIGDESPETVSRLASVLEPYLSSDNLFIISTDFSHYPNCADANTSDSIMAEAILSNSARTFLKVKQATEAKRISNPATSVCSWSSVTTLLNITGRNADLSYRKIMHGNSGDSGFGEQNRVVGYQAIGLYQKKLANIGQFNLTDEEKQALLRIARTTIREYAKNRRVPTIDKKSLTPNLAAPAGAFVTITENGRLRGCIGCFQASDPLFRTIQSMAVSSSTMDPRFRPVQSADIDQLKIEISVLTPMRKIKSLDEIVLGKHGIYMQKGSRNGTFLPQVATETKWTKEEFLGHCARDKANIGWDGWKQAELFVYEAFVFGEWDNEQ